MKRLLLALFIALPAFAQLTPAEMKSHVFTNLPSGSLLTAFRFRDTFTNLIESVLFIDNNLSDLADAATARSNLGLEIGVDVQAYDPAAGDVVGPSSATDGSVALFDSTTGKLLKSPSLFSFQSSVNYLHVGGTSFSYGRTNIGRVAAESIAGWAYEFQNPSDRTNVNKITSVAGTATAARSISWPDASGIVALLPDLAGYQPLDADLTTYAGITPSANVQTLMGSANYASVRAALGIDPSVIASGTATLVAGAVTVSHGAVSANSRIVCTGNADGGTPGWLRVSARVASTSFTITSSSGTDTSTVAWILAEP